VPIGTSSTEREKLESEGTGDVVTLLSQKLLLLFWMTEKYEARSLLGELLERSSENGAAQLG